MWYVCVYACVFLSVQVFIMILIDCSNTVITGSEHVICTLHISLQVVTGSVTPISARHWFMGLLVYIINDVRWLRACVRASVRPCVRVDIKITSYITSIAVYTQKHARLIGQSREWEIGTNLFIIIQIKTKCYSFTIPVCCTSNSDKWCTAKTQPYVFFPYSNHEHTHPPRAIFQN